LWAPIPHFFFACLANTLFLAIFFRRFGEPLTAPSFIVSVKAEHGGADDRIVGVGDGKRSLTHTYFMPTRTQQIIALRKKGMTRRQIADRLAISKNLVGSYLQFLLRKGTIQPISSQEADRRRPRKSAKVDVAEAKRLRRAGETYKEIGMRYGVSGTTISALIGSTVRVTPVQRELIRLHRKGLSYNAIAAHLEKPEGTVAVHLSRLVKRGLVSPRQKILHG